MPSRSTPISPRRSRPGPLGRGVVAALVLGAAACAAGPPAPSGVRAYDPERDSFAFANQTVWAPLALAGPAGPPGAGYYHRCFVMARSVRQFHLHARFDPSLPALADTAYRDLIREVVARDPRGDRAATAPVVFPGFADLRGFSRSHEVLLKDGIGSALGSYFQVGNWRLFFPFTRSHQARVAEQLQRMLATGRPAIVHAVRFPIISINHAVMVYAAAATPAGVRFTAYDPNVPDAPLVLTYDRAARTFLYPATNYFWGGPVNVYEVYRRGLF